MLDQSLLWQHQIDAIEMVKKYIADFNTGLTNKSALVQMPTGSGKSGVIAILSRYIVDSGTIIILTPRVSLRDQLARDINGRFFEKIGFNISDLPKKLIVIEESKQLESLTLLNDSIYIMTIQMLNSIADNYETIFESLSDLCSLLMVDEGHYEPAKEWSKVIRKILVPKVIFTATPYRNDYKVFDIDKSHSYFLSLTAGQRNGYLRKIEFINRQSRVRSTPQNFIDDIIEFYESKFSSPGDNPPRVIIRCDDSTSIRHLANALLARGKAVIGIHETFRDMSDGWERKKVPNPEEEKAIFWIHQFKLLEGIDDPRFQVLAMYEKINSARSLVQQVGRIIRNPERIRNATGYILEHWDGLHSLLWDTFIKFDKALDELGSDAIELSVDQGILNKIIDLQPKVSYIDKRFRTQFNFDDFTPERDLNLPLKASFNKKLDSFSIDNFVQNIVDYYEENDCLYHIYTVRENIRVILSINYSNSPFLANHVFIESGLNVFVICEFSKYICVYDSSNVNYIGKKEDGMGGSLDTRYLKKLFSKMGKANITSVSLYNSNLGTSSIRSRTINAVSIDATVPGFDDYAQICTTAEGYICDEASCIIQNGPSRRYVGFSRGTVTQSYNKYQSFQTYINWLMQLQVILEKDLIPIQLLSRYALEKKVPEHPQPKNILLDTDEIFEGYSLIDDEDTYFQIEDKCLNIIDGKFQIKVNEKEYVVDINFENDKYYLKSIDLDASYSRVIETLPKSLIRYFNNTQSFRILPEDYEVVYVRGQFYNPSFKVGRKFDKDNYELRNCFFVDNKIGTCESEKGYASYYAHNDNTWDPVSLFGIIAGLGNTTTVSSEFGNPNFIICDDVGTEIADFILCDTINLKVIFIHAKANSNPSFCSASSLHEVCSQAVKNLGYLAMFNDFPPSKLNSWNGPWKAKVNDGSGKVKNRILKSDGTKANSIWKKIRACTNNPMVEKEVWLFLGNIISKKHFELELAKSNPAPNVVQAAYLLNATMSDVASVGAKLKIFCNE